MTFGTFISTRRKELKQNLRDTAKYLKIAYGYLSDLYLFCLFIWICYSRGVGKAAPTNFQLNPDKVPTESLLHSDFVPAILATVAGMRQNNSLKARCLVVLGNFYSCH